MKWNYGNPPEPESYIETQYIVSIRDDELGDYTDAMHYAGNGKWRVNFFEYDNIYAWAEMPESAPLPEENKDE